MAIVKAQDMSIEFPEPSEYESQVMREDSIHDAVVAHVCRMLDAMNVAYWDYLDALIENRKSTDLTVEFEHTIGIVRDARVEAHELHEVLKDAKHANAIEQPQLKPLFKKYEAEYDKRETQS